MFKRQTILTGSLLALMPLSVLFWYWPVGAAVHGFSSRFPGDTLKTIQWNNLEFSHPLRFERGTYDTAGDFSGHFRKLFVLVDPHELGAYSLDAIPIGSVATISISVGSGEEATFLKSFTDYETVKRFFSRDIREEQFERKIGGVTAYQLPGYPGPHGETSYYYLVPLSDGRYFELTAHKYFFNKKKDRSGGYPETHYDRVIEIIIETMKNNGAAGR